MLQEIDALPQGPSPKGQSPMVPGTQVLCGQGLVRGLVRRSCAGLVRAPVGTLKGNDVNNEEQSLFFRSQKAPAAHGRETTLIIKTNPCFFDPKRPLRSH